MIRIINNVSHNNHDLIFYYNNQCHFHCPNYLINYTVKQRHKQKNINTRVFYNDKHPHIEVLFQDGWSPEAGGWVPGHDRRPDPLNHSNIDPQP